jgi:hypothetical protein
MFYLFLQDRKASDWLQTVAAGFYFLRKSKPNLFGFFGLTAKNYFGSLI